MFYSLTDTFLYLFRVRSVTHIDYVPGLLRYTNYPRVLTFLHSDRPCPTYFPLTFLHFIFRSFMFQHIPPHPGPSLNPKVSVSCLSKLVPLQTSLNVIFFWDKKTILFQRPSSSNLRIPLTYVPLTWKCLSCDHLSYYYSVIKTSDSRSTKDFSGKY